MRFHSIAVVAVVGILASGAHIGSPAVGARQTRDPAGFVLALNLGNLGGDSRNSSQFNNPRNPRSQRGRFERGGESQRVFGPVNPSRLGSYTGSNLGSYTGSGLGSYGGGGMGNLSTFGTDATNEMAPPR